MATLQMITSKAKDSQVLAHSAHNDDLMTMQFEKITKTFLEKYVEMKQKIEQNLSDISKLKDRIGKLESENEQLETSRLRRNKALLEHMNKVAKLKEDFHVFYMDKLVEAFNVDGYETDDREACLLEAKKRRRQRQR